jgi:CrcB protein
MNWFMVAFGGSIGAIIRYGIDRIITNYCKNDLIGILSINVSGSFILGIILGFMQSKVTLNSNLHLMLTVGFCASFTTFSSITVSSAKLILDGDYQKALFNIVGNLTLGLIAALLGIYISKNLV